MAHPKSLLLGLAIASTPSSSDDVVNLGEGGLLEGAGVGHRDVGAAHPLHGGVEVVKGVRLHQRRRNLGPHTVHGPSVLHRDDAICPDDRVNNGLRVEGADRPQVDDLSVDPLLGKHVGSLQAEANHSGEADQCDVGAGPHNLCLVKGEHKVILGSLIRDTKRSAIHQLILKENNGVGVADRRLEEAPRVFAIKGSHHLETRAVSVPRRKALRMLRPHPRRGPVGPPEDDGALDVASRHIMDLGC
mmetsp:Transcript_22635/g.52546  ORF Transcript_22635/g.52546 Transcript_22635/m.52546 type:complete len:245 (-) Transcript_22635:398-1132(-)